MPHDVHIHAGQVSGFLEKIYDPEGDVLCLLDNRGVFLMVSENCGKLLGYSVAELIGKRVYDFVYEPDLPRSKELSKAMAAGATHNTFQNSFKTKSGKLVNLSWFFSYHPETKLCYAQFRESKTLGTVIELLERHREEITTLLDSIQEGFFAVNSDWTITHWNYLTERVSGVSRAVAVGKNLWEIFPDAVQHKSFQMLDEALRHQEPRHFQEYYPELKLYADISVNPSPVGLSVFYRDITGQKQREKEMETFLFIIQKASNLIMVMDDQGLLTWANDAFWERTGLTPATAVGKSGTQLLTQGGTSRKAMNQMRRQVSQGLSFRGDLQLHDYNKNPFWIDISCQPVYSAKGRLLKFIIVATDITEQKELEKLLEAERNKQQQRITLAAIKAQEQERSQIGLELHDDINQVLTTIKLYLELSSGGVPNAMDLQKKSIDLLQHCINGIRSLSVRLSAPTLGKISLANSLRELIKASGILETTQVKQEIAGVDKLGISNDLHLAVYRIVQAQIANIIRHAKATEVLIRVWTEGSELHLLIQDNGVGFTSGKPTKGLGLKNMRSRAESLGGLLEIKSTHGHGVILQASFPYK